MRALSLFVLFLSFVVPTAEASPADMEKMIARAEASKLELTQKIKTLQKAPATPENTEKLTRAYDSLAHHEMQLKGYKAAMTVLDIAIKNHLDDPLLHITASLINTFAQEWQASADSLDTANQQFSQLLKKASEGPAEEWDKTLDSYLLNRNEWSNKQLYLALAQGQASQAVRWSETGCNYLRLYGLKLWAEKKNKPISVARWLEFDSLLKNGLPLAEQFTALPCIGDGYDTMFVMIAQARAGKFDPKKNWKEVYPTDDPVYDRLADLFIENKAISDQELEELSQKAEPELADRLDRLCEAHYMSGMYYLYQKKDVTEARRQFEQALNTSSISSTEYKLARFELELLKTRPVAVEQP